MNLRTIKKKQKRAVEALVSKHGWKREQFTPADGGDAINAPTGMERQFVRHGFLNQGPLKGTLLTWQKVSYEYDEGDCSLPSEILAEIEYWESLTPDELKEMALA